MMQLIETARQEADFGETIAYDISADGIKVGTMSVYDYTEALLIERIDINKGYRNHGYGADAVYEVSKGHDYIYAAPDNSDSKRFFARYGEEVNADSDWTYLDQGYGVYLL